MPTFNGSINNFVAGDRLEVRRTVSGLLAPITKAWLTIKQNANDLDSSAVQKIVTPDLVAGVGQVVTPGGVDVSGEIAFFLMPEDTASLASQVYEYDIQVLDENGGIYTPETGTITAHAQITKAQS